MAHYYTDRTSFYGIEIDRFLPFNFLRDVHIQSPIVWIGLSWIGAALFLAPAISGGEPKGQAFLVDVLFWVTLLIVVGALAGNYLGIMGYIARRLVLVRQSGALLHPARPRLADRLLRRAGDLERARLPRAVADPRHAVPGDPAILVGADPPRASDLGVDRQYRRCFTSSA